MNKHKYCNLICTKKDWFSKNAIINVFNISSNIFRWFFPKLIIILMLIFTYQTIELTPQQAFQQRSDHLREKDKVTRTLLLSQSNFNGLLSTEWSDVKTI